MKCVCQLCVCVCVCVCVSVSVSVSVSVVPPMKITKRWVKIAILCFSRSVNQMIGGNGIFEQFLGNRFVIYH